MMNDLEVRYNKAKNKMIIEGKAVAFNSPTVIGNNAFIEVVKPEAMPYDFVMNSDVRFLLNHDPSRIYARTANGSLNLYRIASGIHMKATLLDIPKSKGLYEQIKAGLIDKMSFGFAVDPDGGDLWEERNGIAYRTILKISQFVDVSAVTFPAYDDTSVKVSA